MRDFIEYQEKIDQQIRKQFGFNTEVLSHNVPITATEVLMRQQAYEPIIEKMRKIIYKLYIDPMGVKIVRMYNMYEGRKRTDRYILKMIKTM